MLKCVARLTAFCALLLTACARETNATIDRIFINGKACLRCADSLMIDRTSVEDVTLTTSLIDSLPIECVGHRPM